MILRSHAANAFVERPADPAPDGAGARLREGRAVAVHVFGEGICLVVVSRQSPGPSEEAVATLRAEPVPRRASPDFGSQSVSPVPSRPAFSVEPLRLVVVAAVRGGERAEEPSWEGRTCWCL